MRQILIIIALVGLGCSREPGPASPNNSGEFALFFLRDSALTGGQVTQMDKSQLVLRDEAWLTDDDIRFYDFSTHCIYLKQDKKRFFDTGTGGQFVFHPVLISKPFVVVANGERCYIGSLHSG
jgi:hypothetical protein